MPPEKHKALDVSQKNSILTLRHLEDKNTLLSEGRDNSLLPNQEKKANQIAREIHIELIKNNCNEVNFYTSDKKRTQQTTELIISELAKSKVCEKINTSFDSRINELNNGIMNFPENFQDGDWFKPLPLAWSSFFQEIFEDDLLYQFGDPKILEDGSNKYPELVGHFNSYGENYASFCSRIFEFLSELNIQKDIESKRLPVIITHNAIISVTLEIAFVYYDFFKKSSEVFINNQPNPTLNKLIWSVYQKYNNLLIKFDMTFGETKLINLSFLNDEEFKKYLKRESRLLKLISQYSN